MNDLNNQQDWSTIGPVSFVILGLGQKTRRIVGLGINVVGAGVLLVDSIRFVGGAL